MCKKLLIAWLFLTRVVDGVCRPLDTTKDVINEKSCTRTAMHHDWQVIPIILIGNEYHSSWHFIWSGSKFTCIPHRPQVWVLATNDNAQSIMQNLNQPFPFSPVQKKKVPNKLSIYLLAWPTRLKCHSFTMWSPLMMSCFLFVLFPCHALVLWPI